MRLKRAGNARRRGFTLLEVMIALAVLALASLGLFSMMIISVHVKRQAREDIMAATADHRLLERMMVLDLQTAFDQYHNKYTFSIPSQDIIPWGQPPGSSKWSQTNKQWTDPQGNPLNQGSVIFPNEDPNDPTQIIENVQPSDIQDPRIAKAYADLGGPWDLNGDGDTSDVLTSSDPELRLLPVIVLVEWKDSLTGQRTWQHLSMLLASRK